MIVLVVFAFVSGVITILSPCILPVLPIVLAGSLGKGRARPLGVIAGFVLGFTFFTLALSTIVQALGVPPDTMRYVAVAVIALFGFVLLVPGLNGLFEAAAARVARLGQGSRSSGPGGSRRGFWSGIPVGLSLGLVWTPCVGPIMASVISLALTKRIDGGSVFITLAYSLGTAVPMFAIMSGGRALLGKVPALQRHAAGIQRGFGALMVLLAVCIGFGFDRKVQAAILTAFPSYGSGLTAVEQVAPVEKALGARGNPGGKLGAAAAGQFSGVSDEEVEAARASDGAKLGDYGAAPPFIAGGPWLNTTPSASALASGLASGRAGSLSLADLRGKVVLVDFWTYSCVNCVRTLPYLRSWYEAYKDKGLVIIGVHSPEFEFEKSGANVSAAVRDLGVTWPVVQDNDFAEWNAYGNKYWPAHYFIDAKGRVRYFHFGEGEYGASERVIQALLKEAGVETRGSVTAVEARLEAQTPETYLGYERGSGLQSSVPPQAGKALEYKPSKRVGNGEWSLGGRWTISSEYITPESEGSLDFGFHAKSVYLVVQSEGMGGSISVRMDGAPVPDTADVKGGLLKPTKSRLYQLVDLPSGGEHSLELAVSGKLRLFAFTFG
jgi:cytochrome c biogenesis protein CcdA/thiol-disulfide isomerase/thioredoxin